MDPLETLEVAIGEWGVDEAAIRSVRHAVFSDEQGISRALDFDGRDPDCVQVIARLGDGEVLGTARMLPDGHVGRLAVHAPWRGRGVGTRMVECLTEAARERGIESIYLHSQASATEFYHRLGYAIRGEPFMEAGIEHVLMVRDL